MLLLLLLLAVCTVQSRVSHDVPAAVQTTTPQPTQDAAPMRDPTTDQTTMKKQARGARVQPVRVAHANTTPRLPQVVPEYDEQPKSCTACDGRGGVLHDLLGAPDLLTLVKACITDMPTAAALERTCKWLHAKRFVDGANVRYTCIKEMDLSMFCRVVRGKRQFLNLSGCMSEPTDCWIGGYGYDSDFENKYGMSEDKYGIHGYEIREKDHTRILQTFALRDMLASDRAGTCTLQTLGLRNNQLERNAEALFSLRLAMASHTGLTRLDLSNNDLEDNACLVKEIAGTSTTLTALDVSCTQLHDNGASWLAKAVLENTQSQLRQLDISRNVLYGVCAVDLAPLCQQLVWLDVSGNEMNASACTVLASAALQSERLEHLVLADLNLEQLQATSISAWIAEARTLTYLDLTDCWLDEGHVAEIGNALLANKTLRTLRLGCASFDMEATGALADALCRNTTLQTLELDCCFLDCDLDLLERLLSGVIHNTTLATLSLQQNHFGEKGVRALARAMKSNTGITALNLRPCPPLQGNYAYDIAIALDGNTAVRVLRLTECGFDAFSSYRLVQNLVGLTDIDLSSNGISGFGMCTLVHRCPQLQSLNLHRNRVRHMDADCVARYPVGNSSITHLVLSENALFARDESYANVCRYLAAMPALARLDLSVNGECTAACMAALAPLLGVSCRLTKLALHNEYGVDLSTAAADTLAALTAHADTLSELHVDCGLTEEGTCDMLRKSRRSPFRVLTAGCTGRAALALNTGGVGPGNVQ